MFIRRSDRLLKLLFLSIVEGTKQSQVEAKLMKDGKPLPLKDVEIVVGEDKITFKIKKPSHDQSGIYQVKIGNSQGEEVRDVNINMQGKPTFDRSFLSQHQYCCSDVFYLFFVKLFYCPLKHFSPYAKTMEYDTQIFNFARLILTRFFILQSVQKEEPNFSTSYSVFYRFLPENFAGRRSQLRCTVSVASLPATNNNRAIHCN